MPLSRPHAPCLPARRAFRLAGITICLLLPLTVMIAGAGTAEARSRHHPAHVRTATYRVAPHHTTGRRMTTDRVMGHRVTAHHLTTHPIAAHRVRTSLHTHGPVQQGAQHGLLRRS